MTKPFFGLFKREIRRFLRVVFQTVGTPLVSAILYLLIFGVSIGRDIKLEAGFSYLAFLIPGIMMMSALRNAFDNSTTTIVIGRYANELQDLKVAPLGNQQILWAISLAGMLRGVIVGVLTLFIGEGFFFITGKQLLAIAHPFWLFYFVCIGTLAFAFMGFFISMIGNNFEQINGISSFILLPLLYLGGIFFPVSSLHPFWQSLSRFNPLLYIIEGTQFSILGTKQHSLIFIALWTLLFALFFHLACLYSLKKGFRYKW